MKVLSTLIIVFLSGFCAAITPQISKIAAAAHILVAYPNFDILSENNSHKKIIPASLTKIMTAYIVFDQIKKGFLTLSEEILISPNSRSKKGSRSFLDSGQIFTVDTLLKGLIIQSGNDAATALAEHIAGSETLFSSLMNEYAKELGMTHTNFRNASGLPDPKHFSTAYDIALLSLNLIKNFEEFYKNYYSKKSVEINGIKQFNRNPLLKHPGVDGIKTGYTKKSGYSLASSIKEEESRFISIVIGAKKPPIREHESLKLLRFASRFFETMQIASKDNPVAKVPVYYSTKKQIQVGVLTDVLVTIPKLEREKVQTAVTITKKIFAPVKLHQVVGELVVRMGEKELNRTPIVSLEVAEEAGWFSKLVDKIRSWFD